MTRPSSPYADPRNLPLVLEANRLREAIRLTVKATATVQRMIRNLEVKP